MYLQQDSWLSIDRIRFREYSNLRNLRVTNTQIS